MAIEPHEFVTQLAQKLVGDQRHAIPGKAADQLANRADVSELASFAGYLGGTVEREDKQWRLLYLDSQLQTWLLVRDVDILYHEQVKDDTAALEKRDVIWVKADASVGRGSGPQSVESRFLTGEFTKAGDFDTAPGGGTMAAATGLFCEARTPFCCWGRRSR
jgi:hypothetical protein